MLNISNSIIKGLFGKLTSFTGIIHDFVFKNWIVQSETKSDWVGSLKIGFSNFSSFFIGSLSIFGGFIVLGSLGVFWDVSAVISLHFIEEDFGFWGSTGRDDLFWDQV